MNPQDTGYKKPDLPVEQQNALSWQSPISAQPATPQQGMTLRTPVALDPPSLTGDSSSDSTTPLAAQDGDLIERAWIDAVKDIFHQHKNDPYSQSQALTKLKAEYLKKRYGKAIKVSENKS